MKRKSKCPVKKNPPMACHCWNCGGNLDNVHREDDGSADGIIVGTCWCCGKDSVSAKENDEEHTP